MTMNVRNGGPLPALGGTALAPPPKGLNLAGKTPEETDPARAGLSPNEPKIQKAVMVCDTQPVTAEGIRTLLAVNPDLRFQQMAESLEAALQVARQHAPDVIVVDKAFGIQAVLEWLNEMRLAVPNIGVVIWGVSVTEAEALRFLQAGARGILRKTAGVAVRAGLPAHRGRTAQLDGGRGVPRFARAPTAIPAASSPRGSSRCWNWWSRASRIRRSRRISASALAPSKST